MSIVTVDDRGTPDRSDDLLVGGATYAVVQDNGDGVYEPDKDGPVLAQISSPAGLTVLQNLPKAAYWIVETAAPPGYDLSVVGASKASGPTNAAQSCFDAGTLTCFADPAGGGMTTVFFVNSPLPAASTASDYRSPIVLIVAIIGVIIVAGAVVWMVRRRE